MTEATTLEATPHAVAPTEDGYVFFVIARGGVSGWTDDFASWRSNPDTLQIVQRCVRKGRRQGSEWTVFGG